MEYEGDSDINFHWRTQYGPKGLERGLEEVEDDHPNYSIVKIGQNTEESPRALRWLAVT